MQSIVFLVVMFTTSAANYDISINVYNSVRGSENRFGAYSTHLFTFNYRKGDMLQMQIKITNIPKDVSLRGVYSNKKIFNPVITNFYVIKKLLQDDNITIAVELSSKSRGCARKQNVIEGTAKTTIINTRHNDKCFRTDPCVVVVDLGKINIKRGCEDGDFGVFTANPFKTSSTPSRPDNVETMTDLPVESDDSFGVSTVNPFKTSSTPSRPDNVETMTDLPGESDDKSSVLTYVLPSVIGTCVIILTICICVKKYCHWNWRSEEGIELNTYATVNEIVYADLSLAQGHRQPARRDETPYAAIIGVMKPVDRNVIKT